MKKYVENLKRLVKIYEEHLEEKLTPTETAQQFIDEVGLENAKETMAAAITVKAWDGRISIENKKYWTPIGEEYGFNESMNLYGIDSIHPAHLDQLAESVRRIIKQQEAAAQDQTAPAEEEPEDEKEEAVHFPIEVRLIGCDIPNEEIAAYVDHALKACPGNVLKGIEIQVDGDYANLNYIYKELPFERIRRITGYLVGTLDRFNNAKRAEVEDRVKHSLGSEESEDIYISEADNETAKTADENIAESEGDLEPDM